MANEETVIRFIPDEKWLTWVDGIAFVARSAFPETELKSKNPIKSSCSLGRPDQMNLDEVFRRAKRRNRRKDWSERPVIAKALVSNLREICDSDKTRQACVYADPIPKSDDPDEEFAAHAFIRRGDPIPGLDRKMEMAVFRRTIASHFDIVTHYDGDPVKQPA